MKRAVKIIIPIILVAVIATGSILATDVPRTKNSGKKTRQVKPHVKTGMEKANPVSANESTSLYFYRFR